MARPKMSLRISSVLAMAGALLAASPALAGAGIDVIMNQAKIVKIARPADTIVVGNPEIADASVQDATTIVLTGKGFGVTNLVILDSEGSPIVDEQVIDALDKVLIPGATNGELKALLVKVRPAFVAHLEHGKRLQATADSTH